MSIKTKDDLLADIISDFANNNSGNITPLVIRTFLTDFVNSNKSFQQQQINSTPDTIDDLSDIVYLLAGTDIVNLPSAANFLARGLTIANDNATAAVLTADGGDQIFDGLTLESTYIINAFSVVTLLPSDAFSSWVIGTDNRVKTTAFAFSEDNGLTTVINSSGVFEDINIPLALFDISTAFSAINNTITYTGVRDIDVEITCHYSFETTGGSPDCSFKAAIDFGGGGEQILLGRSVSAGINNNTASGSFMTNASVITGDVIHFIIANLDGTQDQDVTDLTISVKEIRR